MKNQAIVLLSFFMLAMTCISCSHSGQITGTEGGLTSDSGDNKDSNGSDVTTEGTSSPQSDNDVSEKAEDRASSMLNGDGDGDSTEAVVADADTKAAAPGAVDALSLGMGGDSAASTVLPGSDPMMVASTEKAAATPSLLTDKPFESNTASQETAAPGSSNTNSDEKSTEPASSSSTERKPAAVRPQKKSAAPAVKVDAKVDAKADSKMEVLPKQETVVKPPSEVAKVDADELEEGRAPIPPAVEKREPKLASAEIGSFIERHVFIVTLGVVGFVFGLFIMMRRNREKEDGHLTL